MRPHGSATSSPLKRDFSGRIVYRETPPQQSAQANRNRHVRVGFVFGPVIGPAGYSSPPESPRAPWNGPTMYLRTGDTIACEVTRIDERGVTISSPRLDATFVPRDKVKAVELENSRGTKIDISKRDRLLTLPRPDKEDPPTHLIRSTDGDYLRGRLVEMDDKTLTVEVRTETRHIPRDRVASIIWLDVSEKNEKAAPGKQSAAVNKQPPPKKQAGAPAQRVAAKQAADAKPTAEFRVQSLGSNGVRLTFRPEKLTGTTLRGTSDVLVRAGWS